MGVCLRCGKALKLKAACICADCVRATMDADEIDRLLHPKP